MAYDIKITQQTPAKLADDSDCEKDEEGYTSPNLHRRISNEGLCKYILCINNLNSFRTTIVPTHDEMSTDVEIP